MKSMANNRFARAMSMLLVLMFMFTLVPASLVMADADYTMTLTSDKASYAAGETVNLTVTLDGAMADLKVVQYSVAYDSAVVTTSTTGRSPSCFNSAWYTSMQNGNELGYINKPSAGINNGALNVVFLSTDGYTVDTGAPDGFYNAKTTVAGQLVFTATVDIADVSKVFTLTNTKVATYENDVQTEKTVEAVQLKSATPAPNPDQEAADAVDALIAALPADITLDDEDAIVAARAAYDGLEDAQKALVANLATLEAAEEALEALKADDGDDEITTDYAMTLTSDKASYAAGETVNLTVTLDGAMADLKVVQYSVAYDSAVVTTSTTGRSPSCFNSAWYTSMQNGNELGYINKPSAGINNGALNVVFLSTDGYTVDTGAPDGFYNAKTTVAGQLVFTATVDIADVSKVFTLTNTKVATYENDVQTEKTVTAVQLKSAGGDEPDVPVVDPDQVEADKVIALIDAIGEVTLEAGDGKITAAEEAYANLTDAQKALVPAEKKAILDAAREDYNYLKDQADKEAADKAAAAAVEALIIKLPTTITLDDEEAIVAARAAYTALTDAQKAYVANLATLEAAEEALEALKADDGDDEITTDYAMTLTSDKASYAAGETVNLTVTLDGAMADLKVVQYSVAYDSAVVTTSTTGRSPSCFNSAWYTSMQNGNELGYINKPSAGINNGALNVVFLSTDGYTVDTGAPDGFYNAKTTVAGQLVFTATVDIADVSKVFTLTNTKVATYENDVQTEKTVTAVQLKSAGGDTPDEPDVPVVNPDQEAADKVIALIDGIGEVALTDECKAAIVAADLAFAALTETQAALVTNKNKLDAAKDDYIYLENRAAADAVIILIDAIGEVKLEDGDGKITAAEEAYAELTEAQKALVPADKKDALTAARATYNALKDQAAEEEADRLAAQAVIEAINATVNADGKVRLEDEEKIVAARNAYDALTEPQKWLVTNLPTLEAAEAALKAIKDEIAADEAKANEVIALINNLPTADRVVLSDEAAIVAARNALNALTSTQYLYVDEDSIAKLVAVEEALEARKAEADQAEKDEAAIIAVRELIFAIPDPVEYTTDCEVAITTARTAYENLTENQKAMFYDKYLNELKVAEETFAQLKANAEADAENKAAAQAVIDLINAIGEVTLEAGDAKILEAYEAYEALTDVQKLLVTNKDDLDAASILYDRLLAAKGVVDLIDAIGEVTLNSGDAIDAAYKAYDNFCTILDENDNVMDYITNYSVLKAAKIKYDNLVAAQEVIDLINAIPEDITLDDDCYAAIVDAETAYALLEEEVAALVTNYATLEAARMTYDELKAAHDKEVADQAAADAVIELIEAIGEVALEDGDAKITAAELAYEVLTDDQRKLVADYYDILVEARETYNQLKADAEQDAIDQAAAATVIELIEAIGEVTLDSLNAIEVAEKAYAELTEDQVALVGDYYEILVAARAAYDELKAEADKPVSNVVNETIDGVTFQMAVITNIPENMVVTVGGKEATMVTNEDGTVKYIVTVDETIDVNDIVVDVPVAGEEAEEIVMGDANLDGDLTLEDALSILLKAANLQTYGDMMSYVLGDVNGDGRITAGDAHILKGVMADNDKAIALVVKP